MTIPLLVDQSEPVADPGAGLAASDEGRIETTESVRPAEPAAEPYTNSWEHIADEMACLDLRIKLQVAAQWARQPASPLDQFKGLVVSDSEVATLLSGLRSSPKDSDSSNIDKNAEILELSRAVDVLSDAIDRRLEASQRSSIPLSLIHLSQLFQLNRLERQCLVICLAAEVDRAYEKLFAYLQDDVTRKKPTVDLVLRLACETADQRLAARQCFGVESPLIRFNLVHLNETSPEGQIPLLLRPLKLDDRIVAYLLGSGEMDARVNSAATLIAPGAEASPSVADREAESRLVGCVTAHLSKPPQLRDCLLVHLCGADGTGKHDLVETLSSTTGLPVVVIDSERMFECSAGFDEAARLAGREAVLQPGILCFDRIDCLTADDRLRQRLNTVFQVSRDFSPITLLLGRRSWRPAELPAGCSFIEIPLPAPGDDTRKRLWEELSAHEPDMSKDVDFGSLASKFRFAGGQIRTALAAARTASEGSTGPKEIGTAELSAACRALSGQKLASLARKIEPHYTWDDIVLPEDALTQLREICDRVVYRQRVLGEWGFAKKLSLGKGVNALFAGPSGTGKTMGTEVIANELSLDLYKIDLSGVVSKYIGETEKNLDRVFSAAEDANAILFFDEADALFGKRSEVRDSHDRYANIEISYLLQKMEEYEGLAILATNLRGNLDESFTRRLAFTIHFPFPDETSRLQIWRAIWPTELTLDSGVNLEFLASHFKLSGGNIKNIAVAAAFLAAKDGGSVAMDHLVRATRREYQKLGKPLTAADLGPYAAE